ncbi:hypothetical protein ABT336_12155 [Micromonospora sp. NPDC000207]|uniref:hypothetical protein n=1 Tax=Micromonospora sp. NPDC000207 TaxID=3154246 RepID=UPI003332CA1F
MGKPMPNKQILPVMERLLRLAEHPDYTNVACYGADSMPGGQSPAGVKALALSGSTSLLWCAVVPADARPVSGELAEEAMVCMPGRTLRLAHRLLDAARPDEFVSWELCAASGVGWPRHGESPSAIRVTGSDGSVAYLRATAASGPRGAAGEPKEDPCPDYQIPQGVLEWHHSRNAAVAVPA